MRSSFKQLLGASIMLAPLLSAYAEVQVVESSSTQQVRQQQSNQGVQQANAQLFMQLQQLQEEVMRMRGLLEEQQFQISQLKQQRLDDYVNLDKRLSDLSKQMSGESAGSGAAPVANTASASSSIPASSPLVAKKAQDKEAYNAAYALIQQRKFEDAKEAFLLMIKDYPDSGYVPNAYYWLGEIYIIDADYTKAKSAFRTVIDQYPDHNKNPESLYKLATVNYEMGDRETAKQQLNSVIDKYADTSVNIVRKARSFLEKHYL